MTAPHPRRRRRAAPVRVGDDLARQLRDRILRNEFADARLPKQEDLIREYEVSAQSLREAFRILEAEGLITVRRGNVGGAVVHVPDASSTAHALGIALQSEGATLGDVSLTLHRLDAVVAGACAARPDRAEEVVPYLRRAIEEAEHDVAGADWVHRSLAFHHEMANRCGLVTAGLLASTLLEIWVAHSDEWTTALGHDRYIGLERRKELISVHRELVELIEAGDIEATERAAAEHLRKSHRALLSTSETTVSIIRIGESRERRR